MIQVCKWFHQEQFSLYYYFEIYRDCEFCEFLINTIRNRSAQKFVPDTSALKLYFGCFVKRERDNYI